MLTKPVFRLSPQVLSVKGQAWNCEEAVDKFFGVTPSKPDSGASEGARRAFRRHSVIMPPNRREAGFLRPLIVVTSGLEAYEQPLVEPQVSHFRQVPLRTMVKLPHSEQLSPS